MWRYLRGLAVPMLLWALFVGLLAENLRARFKADEHYDEAALREWVDESRVFRDALPELVRGYLDEQSNPTGRVPGYDELIRAQLEALGNPVRMYQAQLPLFPTIYRMEVRFQDKNLPPIVWESGVPRPRQSDQVHRLDHGLLGSTDDRATLHFEYQMHAYNKRQRDEAAANTRLRWITLLAVAATALSFLWIALFQRQERERERHRAAAREQIDEAERLALEEELRRREAERKHEEAERSLLEQRLATQAAERQALELKSQLYASIGIMAGSYAHNIKNLLVRPNDLLRRCLEADGLSTNQNDMLVEVRRTLGTVTERLQQILQTVRRDPHTAELSRLDLNAVVRDIQATWDDLAREKWKLTLQSELADGPLWIDGDASHLQQAIENLLFNARDATFEMRNTLRLQARGNGAQPRDEASIKKALIEAAAWKGSVTMRTRRDSEAVVLEVADNGIGMNEEVRRRCTETHFSTKRDNALYEGHSTGMGLGLSFVVVVLDNHRARLEVESQPEKGTLFRARFRTNNAE
ncbi:MAG: sensor histidine kinase [Gemmataceae bacterium]